MRLSDGRILPARLVAKDAASDIALLRVDARLRPIGTAPAPQLAEPVCAIANAYGLGLSVTCGVISALNVTGAGFNAVEDFVQTDAAANPGSSGGALVDREGRLVGMMSAIFASSDGDTNIGINFAVSTELLMRVVEALLAEGKVAYPSPGWRLEAAGRDRLASVAAPMVGAVSEGGRADAAGIRPGDRVLKIGQRRVRTPRDAIAAFAVIRDPGAPVDVALMRGAPAERLWTLSFDAAPEAEEAPDKPEALADCPHPAPVCLVRQAVFPVFRLRPGRKRNEDRSRPARNQPPCRGGLTGCGRPHARWAEGGEGGPPPPMPATWRFWRSPGLPSDGFVPRPRSRSPGRW